MDKKVEDSLTALFHRAGLMVSEKDRERFIPMLEAYLQSVDQLHSINLGDEEIAPVFRPDLSGEA